MAVDCSRATARFLASPTAGDLPVDVQKALREAKGDVFLDALSETGLRTGFTDEVFVWFGGVVVEVCARWVVALSSTSTSTSISTTASASLTTTTIHDEITVVSCLARIYPFARYLRANVLKVLRTGKINAVLRGDEETLLSGLDGSDLSMLLLGLFRLLSADPAALRDVIKPSFLSTFFNHDEVRVRYLAVLCYCVVMKFADGLCEKLIEMHVGSGALTGEWEGRDIDYRILRLLEEKRWKDLERRIVEAREIDNTTTDDGVVRFETDDLSPSTADIGGVLVPRDGELRNAQTSFVSTPTAVRNLAGFGHALLQQKPTLVTGSAGSGKTALITESARLLNKQSSMITLHLNEQTDAKSLLGVYTSSASGDAFVWQPGVLTKAVQQGRWVIIEDIDRAPAEVLGVLRPIIENGELFLPSRKERVRPAEGFRIFATVKTSSRSEKSNQGRHAWLSNERLWSTVRTLDYENTEIRDLLNIKYPQIQPLSGVIMEAHESVCAAYRDEPSFRAVQSRLPSLRDLLKWCRRIFRNLHSHQLDITRQAMPESVKLDIFKDAIDCYAAYHNDNTVYQEIASRIAQAMNIPPQQANHVLGTSILNIEDTKSQVAVGRSTIRKITSRRSLPLKKATFALTNTAKRSMESITAGVYCSEPLLLVGETGVGKTTIVQHIANLANQKLTVVNLSQQSEATDLLGGLKPITTRSLIIPLLDLFSTLFDDTFSNKRNEKFQIAISRAVSKQNWQRLLLLWAEAVQMAEKALSKSSEISQSTSASTDGQAAKRRKITTKYAALRERWTDFTSKLNQVRSQVERGDKHHTFAFVEGRLVQAVRAGEWLLLDEINLASADTLDHVIGLLRDGDDGTPSLLLTEAGNIEQVTAHPDFRIFAAMNPATDAGKKDLAPGLRGRFTEIYVPAGDSDADDLVKIIETYLGTILSSDKYAASDLAKAYLELNKLNQQHRLTDGAGDVPHFSIRSLVRCLLYVIQNNPSHGLRRSMHEGFAMSFFTVLSRESENLALPLLNKHLLSNVRNTKSFLSQQPKMPFDGDMYVAFRHHLVVRGTETPDLQPHYIRTPSVERNLVNLARATAMRRFPILLQGPTSAGKTSMVEYLAKLSGNKFMRINNHEHTDLQEYLGSYATGDNGKLEFREGVLVEALRKGHWIVLDELNLAPSDVLEALNRLLDDNRELLIPESQEVVRPHPNFMLFATQNPAGLYGGRKRLSRAFRNRFLELHFDDIPEDELEVILRERAQIAPSFCTQIVQVYKKLSLQRQSTRLFEQRNSFATLRDLFRWASRPVDDRQQLAQHGFMLLAERVRDPAERRVVKTTIEETMRVKIDENVLYGPSVVPATVETSSSIVWTSAIRRLFVLVSAALNNNEPVLLVGETGCGKTQICQTLAQAFNRVLSVYNAHSNTETGDLIGSQRPIRQRTELATAVLESFNQLSAEQETLKDADVDDLIESFSKMDTSSLDPDAVARTKQSIGAYRSLFAWNDGSLIRSMKAGEHFLLDEISLADDSVLERLNSVLEPSRTILLAEKGTTDNLVSAHPGFQFLATMNPGGDYGKRELSAALRNRLTEIWVPPLSQDDDILPILRTKLGTENERLATAMLGFATWFRDNMQGTATSAISLRSLIAWAEFIDKNDSLVPEVAFVHGASLIYIDSLGANPAGLTSTTAADVASARQKCLQELQSLTSANVSSIYNMVPAMQMAKDTLTIGAFSLQRTESGKDVSELVFDAPTTLMNTMRIVRALQMYRPILLEGSPGVGKTAIVTALAEAVGKPLTRINLSDQTDLMDLFGADAPADNEKLGRFSWRDGPLLQAMQTGGWVLLDEMNLASQSVLEGLNSCLDHRREAYIAELDKSFTCHPEFKLFAAQNPHHQGGGRKGLPASFVNRFTVVYADPFQREDFLCICRRTRPSIPADRADSIIDAIASGHHLVTTSPAFSSGGPWELNLRDVNRWLDLCEEYITLAPVHHFDTVIAQRFRGTKARDHLGAIRHQFFLPEPESSLYHNLSTEVFQLGTAFLSRHSLVQNVDTNYPIPIQHLQYAKSIITALNHRWPVVLVGPSGSGKTRMIHSLAALSGAKLVEFSMNADIDTMDLIGGFEQHDVKREVLAMQNLVCETITLLICESIANHEKLQALHLLTEAYEQCSVTEIDANTLVGVLGVLSRHFDTFTDCYNQLTSIIEAANNTGSRFVWNDGILIDALQSGSWLVLDNANLCNPSVLDRLNSLLEPNGSLTVSEQHNSGEKERVIEIHPNFRIFLTMDSRYGELSRAMRNRSLELYIGDEESASSNTNVPAYCTTASISRLRLLSQNSADSSLQPALQYISRSDLSIATTYLESQSDTAKVEDTTISEIADWSHSPAELVEQADAYYTRAASQACKTAHGIVVTDQPQLPALNDALLNLITLQGAEVEEISRKLLLEIQYSRVRRTMKQVHDGISETRQDQMTVLQQSLSQLSSRTKQQRHRVPQAYQFLEILVQNSHASMWKSTSTAQELSLRADMLALVEDLQAFFGDVTFNQEVFQAYLLIIKDFNATTVRSNIEASSSIERALELFQPQFSLQFGLGLQQMWPIWKPITAKTTSQLQAQLAMEDLVANFDRLSMTLPQSRSTLAQIRSRLVASIATIMTSAEPTTAVSVLTQAVDQLSALNRRRKPQRGYFHQVFHWLLRLLVLQDRTQDSEKTQVLTLFARSTSHTQINDSDSIPVKAIKRLSFYNNIGTHDDVSTRADFTNVAKKLLKLVTNVQTQPLDTLDHVEEEMSELTNAICHCVPQIETGADTAIKTLTLDLVRGIMTSYSNQLTHTAQKILNSSDVDSLLLMSLARTNVISGEFSASRPLNAVFDHHIRRALSSIAIGVQNEKNTKLTEVVQACYSQSLIMVALAALKLLVPDRAFDPSIYPTLIEQRHLVRVRELRTKITSQKAFQQMFTGQGSSLLIRMYEHDIQQLHDVPSAPVVVRPSASELQYVQEEFANVIRGVIEPDIQGEIINRQNITVARATQETVSRLVTRLSKLNRAYDDFVKPVIWLLECLWLGTTLFMKQLERNADEPITKIAPLASPLLTVLVREGEEPVSRHGLRSPQELERIKLASALERTTTTDKRAVVLSFLRVAEYQYEEWKSRLSKDQAEAEAKSRYYAYRGEDEAAQEADEQEMASLFPIFDVDDEIADKAQKSAYDARATAIKLASLHQSLFIPANVQTVLMDYLLKIRPQPNATDTDFADQLPAILLAMEKSLNGLKHNDHTTTLNIYEDSDIIEVRRLLKIVGDVQTRFDQISTQWPEHAVPTEVLNFCDELLAFRIKEPIAKLLTKTEKLLEIIAQWQSVASREWSVINLIETLTNLIISWRRLELSSWSRLLDLEQKKNEEDADAWYFIAYEAVIHNSRLVIDQDYDMTKYCQELVATLEEFLKTTTMGQFSNRLRLLTTFHQTLELMTTEEERLKLIAACLMSVLTHYKRYEPNVHQTLAAGRAELEKNIREQIQLASWKDTNPSSLRDSARRSHFKLFKIVKKYRAIMVRPMITFKADDEHTTISTSNLSEVSKPQENGQQLTVALRECAERIDGWASRPQRLTDPIGATVSMRKVYIQNLRLDVAEELASIRDDISSTAKELRKQTPQTLTEENTSLVRHLRERKRRLFADTMKSITQMGVRRNLGTTELSGQHSSSIVLARSPDIGLVVDSADTKAANDFFHMILDTMPTARTALREHSDDLTDGEVIRGVGLLEGLLSVIITQRMSLSRTAGELQKLSTSIKSLRILQTFNNTEIIHITSGQSQKRENLLNNVVRIVPVLQLTCHILDFQSQRVKIDLGELLQQLQSFSTKLRSTSDQIEAQAKLPSGLTSLQYQQATEDCELILTDLRSVLQIWQAREARIGYLIRPLIAAMNAYLEPIPNPDANGVVKLSIEDLDAASRRITDQTFVAMQRVASILSASPEATEDSGWLTKSNKVSSDSMKALHISDIATTLDEILSHLHSTSSADMPLALAILSVATPVLEQYRLIAKHMHSKHLAAHLETCRLAALLSKSFISLINEGFCTPAEPSNGQEQSGKLESGTGLGEGEGAEDISKDIGADEDLSELAQAADQAEKDDKEMDKSKDAVDMGPDDLEGEMGSGDEKDSDDEDDCGNESGSENDNDMDEETGSVDELDPSAVDEKMWDDVKNEKEKEDKEMKGEGDKGTKTDDQTAKDDGDNEEGDDEGDAQDDEAQSELTDAEDEPEGQGRPEAENIDPHLQEEQALEIPEDIQFDGEEGKEDDASDDGMDGLSDVEQPDGIEPEQVDRLSDHDKEEQKDANGEDEADDGDDEPQEDGTAQEDDVMEDQPEELEDKQEGFDTREDEMQYDLDDNEGGDTGVANQKDAQADAEQDANAEGQNDSEKIVDEQQTQSGKGSEHQQKGDAAQGAVERGAGREDEQRQRQDDALKKLADVLEQFHQRREILTASEERKQGELDQDVDMEDAEFEHLDADDEDNDAQALGAAGTDQAQNLDESKAIEDKNADADQDLPMPEDQEMQEGDAQEETIAERFSRLQAQPQADRDVDAGALVADRDTGRRQPKSFADADIMEEELEDPIDIDITHGQREGSPPTSVSDAAALWADCSTRTHALSLLLTEQLRLILAPTTATKLRGDFRTGKRLNIKRIIPYIASGYKRDKIWMRRSIPSKRNYQIMIAVDDSKSMSESGADLLAFDTLAMLSRSLSMLEAGELSIVSFGEEEHIRVAHPFSRPFTSAESGVEVFRNFSFKQQGTDVRKLIRESISIFQDARLRTSSQQDNLWQLQLIVSDGHCSDHETVRRLVRSAHDQKIMIVFVIVDAGQDSIVDLKEAVFEREDPTDDRSEMKVKTKRYLEGFPFQYYVVVREVGDLPGVLARVLKGWFEGVVDVQ